MPAKASGRVRPRVFPVEDDEFSHQLVAITLESQDVELVVEAMVRPHSTTSAGCSPT
jgi:hypothetical protein